MTLVTVLYCACRKEGGRRKNLTILVSTHFIMFLLRTVMHKVVYISYSTV